MASELRAGDRTFGERLALLIVVPAASASGVSTKKGQLLHRKSPPGAEKPAISS